MSDEPLLVSRPWRAWTWVERSTVGLPLALLVFDLLGTSGSAGKWHHTAVSTDVRPLDWMAWAMVAVGPVALYFRMRFPRSVLAVILIATLVYLVRGYTPGPIWLNAIFAIVTAIGTGYRREAWIGAVLFALGIAFVPPHFGVDVANVVSTVGWLLAVTLVPELARVLRQRAEEAQKIRAEEDRRRAGEERLAIARELHDVLAHSISLIAIQANVALEVMDRKPEQARIALTAIKDVSKTALGEVRSVLDVLRGTESAPREPAPGFDQIRELVRRTRATGLTVRVQIAGKQKDALLPVPVGQAAYRIVQEALTNVVRHAGATYADIMIFVDETLVIRIVNDVHGDAGHRDGSGNGIPGMRERAEALGGTLEARPLSGTFRVDARIPIDSTSTPTPTPTPTVRNSP